jgi:redox-sensitive bicupin YhaK (pirin superfamily)
MKGILSRMLPFLPPIMAAICCLLLVALLALPAAAQSPSVTPHACPITSVTTGGTAVTGIPARVNGGVIANFSNASESLFVDQTTTATTTQSATNYPLAAGQSWYVVPYAGPVSVNAASSAHSFFCVIW